MSQKVKIVLSLCVCVEHPFPPSMPKLASNVELLWLSFCLRVLVCLFIYGQTNDNSFAYSLSSFISHIFFSTLFSPLNTLFSHKTTRIPTFFCGEIFRALG